MLTWPALATFTGVAAMQQPIEKGVQVRGCKLVGGAVVGSADPRDDQPGPVEPVPLHPGRVEAIAGLAQAPKVLPAHDICGRAGGRKRALNKSRGKVRLRQTRSTWRVAPGS
jgi:hypothetical protein